MSGEQAAGGQQAAGGHVHAWAVLGEREPPRPDGGSDGAQTIGLLNGCTVTPAPDASIDEKIAVLTEPQRGRVARWQLLAAGVGSSAIGRRTERGRLIVVHRSVYALPGTNAIPHASDAAGLLSAGRDALLADHSACVLYRMRPGVAHPVHVVVPIHRRGAGRTPGLIVHRSRILTPRDVRICDGLPVTSPARVLLDVAARLPDRDVERLLADAIYSLKLVTPAEIHEILNRAGRHPGAHRLARVAGSPLQTESPPETDLLELIRRAGLEEPETQVDILGHRVDFFWRARRLIVEVDAYGTHGSRAKFESDRRRDARLTAAGYTVIRITREQIERQPFAVIALLARLLAT